ncbi:MAG: DNA mismatch repair endonuclease MutL, partial [Gammaproteobacteria bacterium]|nr:DNA mismatch repair endonuclease MutL [Gammaproteobacteria bacterium]
MPIRLLPSELVDQIAAGEVVERPASIVKELIENSLDAGATRIEVDVEGGGIRLVRVRDDGRGVDAAELALAVQRHATSKIATLEDLAAVRSLGFRGEALPSIGSIARLRIASRRREAPQGAEIVVEGGAVSEVLPAALPAGTLVEVRDVFFNVPARRKFLRSESTELSHVVRLVERCALARFDVAFRLRSGSRALLDVPVADTPAAQRARIGVIMGREFAASCLELAHQAGPVRLSGWIGQPQAARAQSDQQYFYVNGRTVRDRLLANAARLGYRDVLYHGRQPAYLLHLDLDPQLVDVNAHPQKLELRFRDGRQVHDFVMRAISRALGVPAGVQPPPGAVAAELAAGTATSPSASGTGAGAAAGASGAAWTRPATGIAHGSGALFAAGEGAFAATAWAVAEAAQRFADAAPAPLPAEGLGTAIAQLHGIYVLAQNAQGLVLVDAHAAHERVLYEKLKLEFGAEPASQALLEPLVVELRPHEAEALEPVFGDFAAAGFELDTLAPGRLAVRRVPAMLGQADVGAIVRDVVRDVLAEEGTHHLEATAHRLLGSLACRSAIHAGRRLGLPEMNALLRQMEQTERAG